MDTTAKSIRLTENKSVALGSGLAKLNPIAAFLRFRERMESAHYGAMTMAVLIGSCLGSITAMFMFYAAAPLWMFAIGLFATLANLVTCIAQAPTRWMINVFFVSVIVNIALIALFPMV